jgi:hypothetical protein
MRIPGAGSRSGPAPNGGPRGAVHPLRSNIPAEETHTHTHMHMHISGSSVLGRRWWRTDLPQRKSSPFLAALAFEHFAWTERCVFYVNTQSGSHSAELFYASFFSSGYRVKMRC